MRQINTEKPCYVSIPSRGSIYPKAFTSLVIMTCNNRYSLSDSFFLRQEISTAKKY